MSRDRLIAKLRSQPWFRAVRRQLALSGAKGEVIAPTGKGHPQMRITLATGAEVTQGIPCTPRQAFAPEQQAARVRRTIEAASAGDTGGLLPPPVRSAWTPARYACLTRGVNPLAGMQPPRAGTRHPAGR